LLFVEEELLCLLVILPDFLELLDEGLELSLPLVQLLVDRLR
jgi:hypothetical protein